ncbi:hypothetical protein QTH50_04850 [Clostridium perfringens]|uniref:hypothetical protein n=1 Tax=Clostridium perfringens TaxID=1502 RepID=UPI000D71D499|nr:hypothetical protein [Clostridium perfringens]MDM0633362.1 hypothetical protein [Clostridium perfringens]MDM0670561.1 hypothetical protein [Clostridium perfringens]MDM0719156.1 hypothetical protein [Clostridium perfringens]PWX39046.1 hypothetical protein CYK90_11820 [Clostridium perfringens]PWX56939.1 hypothetical protein CYK89_01425 [Clostridium perfringens]
MNKINIIYVDDELDVNISKYIRKTYNYKEFEKVYNEITFEAEKGYESLLNNKLVKEANIILIDSKLFENDRVSNGKFSGEEFKMILKKVFPFIEVIVITQNELEEEYGTVSKYKFDVDISADKYYSDNLKKELDTAANNVFIYRNIAKKLKCNEGIDKVLIEKIVNSLDGDSKYDELTKDDIDNIIEAFKELQRGINERGL